MNPEEFVDFIRNQTDASLQKYINFFRGGSQGEDPAFNLAGNIFNSLSEADRLSFVEFLRNVQTDTLGTVFDLLDNQAYPNQQKVDLELKHGADTLNGDLTDILFEKEELSHEKRPTRR